MAESGAFFPFPATLDPYAQEFLPSPHHHFVPLPPHFYYPFPPPPPPPPPQPPYPPTIYAPVPNQPPVPPPLPPPCSSPTRTLLLSSVPTDLSESAVRRDLEIFGDVRAVEMERVREGIVTVHFYDLRAAHAALVEIRDQHMQHQHRLREHYTALMVNGIDVGGFGGVGNMAPLPPAAAGLVAGRAVWAQFMIPGVNRFPDGCNQGTLVVFNLDSNVSMSLLRDMFDPYGPVKEWRDTPMKRHQRFVEFYDVRDAAKALAALNGKEINGKTIMIEFSRPGGHVKRFSSNSYSSSYHHHQQQHDQIHHPSSASRAMNRRPPPQSPPTSRPPSCILKRFPRQMASNFGPRVKGWFSGHRRSPSTNETSNVEREMGRLTTRDTREEGESSERTTMKKPPGNGSTTGSRWSSYGSGSSASSSMHQKDEEEVEERGEEERRVPVTARGGERRQATKGRRNFDPRFLIKEEAIVVGSISSCSRDRDTRTTVMIKNIPNKYSQKLLLNMLDNHCIHCNEQIIADGGEVDQPLSSYDFVYLPIDFNNKCNVGYGFVNMTSPEGTLRLYKAFHKQHWEVFNSRKICEVTYARIQGLESLKEHFKNSKFACETEEYLPVVFSPPRDGSPNNSPNPLPIVALRQAIISALHVDGPDSSSSTTSTITAPDSSCRRDSRDHITLDSDSCDDDDDDDDDRQHQNDGVQRVGSGI